MKKLLLLLVLPLFFACSSDDDANTDNIVDLIEVSRNFRSCDDTCIFSYKIVNNSNKYLEVDLVFKYNLTVINRTTFLDPIGGQYSNINLQFETPSHVETVEYEIVNITESD